MNGRQIKIVPNLCDHCGGVYDNAKWTIVDGAEICDGCLTTDFVLCESCGGYTLRAGSKSNPMAGMEGTLICSACATKPVYQYFLWAAAVRPSYQIQWQGLENVSY